MSLASMHTQTKVLQKTVNQLGNDVEERLNRLNTYTDDIENASIFISIINYRDIEGQFTLFDIFQKAKNPSRIHIGYCLQYKPTEDSDILYHYHRYLENKQIPKKNIRTIFMSYKEARGPTYARYLVQNKLYSNEKYIMHIDCHMRFIPNWDIHILQEFHKCNDIKAIITCYPSAYDKQYDILLQQNIQKYYAEYKTGIIDESKESDRNMSHLSNDDRLCIVENWKGTIDVSVLDKHSVLLCAQKFDGKDGFLRLQGKFLNTFPVKPLQSLFCAAGFNFCLGSVVRDVRADPSLKCLFFGEETINSIRLYTHGYNFYCPTKAICYHLWKRAKNFSRKGIWRELFVDDECNMYGMEKASKLRVEALIVNADCVDRYGLGSERTLEEYERFCGLNFREKIVGESAMFGGLNEKEREEYLREFVNRKIYDLISQMHD